MGAAPEAVFALLDDPERAPDIMPRVTRGERVGDRVRHHVSQRGRDGWVDSEVVERTPPRRLVLQAVAAQVRGKPAGTAGMQRVAYDLEPAAGGTRVCLTIRGAGANAGERVMIGFNRARMTREARTLLRRLGDYAGDAAR